jgi:protein-S-isoprenylcysteine O-methyltransferase Ste14
MTSLSMQEVEIHRWATWLVIGFAPITCLLLTRVTAPYGRHFRPGWGPELNDRLGWILMELPTVAVFVPVFFAGDHCSEWVPLIFLGFWLSHYLYRTFIFPFRIRSSGKHMAVVIVVLGAMFNTLNAYINSRQLSQFGNYDLSWLVDPRFALGALTFIFGAIINRRADRTLLQLRDSAAAPGDYKVPYGGLYRYISCPNYLGEIIQWTGFALLTWSLPAFAFAVYTAANVGPRAMANHAWYHKQFSDYPPERRAIIPFLL